MLKHGDYIYNKFLKKYFKVVEAECYWDRDNCHSLVKPKTESKAKFRKWTYRVQPTDNEWVYEKTASRIINKPYYWRIEDRAQQTFKKIPTRIHKEDMSIIFPGTFEEIGFRLLGKEEFRVLRVLFG